MYDGENYGALDGGDLVGMFGFDLQTGWVSLGTIVNAGENSILNYVPIIPGANTKYTQYRPIGGDRDFDEKTQRLETTISIIDGLGLTGEWNKTSGQESHRKIVVSLSKKFDL